MTSNKRKQEPQANKKDMYSFYIDVSYRSIGALNGPVSFYCQYDFSHCPTVREILELIKAREIKIGYGEVPDDYKQVFIGTNIDHGVGGIHGVCLKFIKPNDTGRVTYYVMTVRDIIKIN